MKRLIAMMGAVALMTACGGGAQEAETTNEAAEPKTMEQEKPVREEVNTEVEEVNLEVHAVGNNMTEIAYEPKRLEVPAGAKVTVTLINKATNEAMIHNFVVINAGTQEEVNEDAMAAGSVNDFLPDNENIIAATSMANPGETVEVEFTAPSEPGTYQFICTYPGHAAMKGVFLVK